MAVIMKSPSSDTMSLAEQLAAVLSADAIAYINERGTEIGTLSAAEMRMLQKAKKLKEQISKLPEVQQLAELKSKVKQVRAKRNETVTKVAGVIEKEIGSKRAGQAIDELFGTDEPKQLKGRE